MKQTLPCEIVQDLLPSYVDGLTNDTTAQAVEDHLEDCLNCRGAYERMVHSGEIQPDPVENKELNFLKKNRKRTLWIVFGSILGAFLLLAGGLFAGFFLVEREIAPESLAYSLEADGEYLYFHGYTVSSGMAVTRVKQEQKDGVLTFHCMGTLVGLHRDDGFALTLPRDPSIREVRLGSRIVWEDGVYISPRVSALYATRHPYVGNMSANAATAEALGIAQVFGSYDNQLHTEQPPYGWTLKLALPIEPEYGDQARRTLRSYAYLMMAVIDNLDTVNFQYQIGDRILVLSVTREDGDRFFGRPLRDCGNDLVLLEQLSGALETQDAFYSVTVNAQDEEALASVVVINDTDLSLKEMGIEIYVNGSLTHSSCAMHADGSPMERGEATYFDVLRSDLGAAGSLSNVTFRINCTDLRGSTVEFPAEEASLHPNIRIYFLQESDGGLILTPVMGG